MSLNLHRKHVTLIRFINIITVTNKNFITKSNRWSELGYLNCKTVERRDFCRVLKKKGRKTLRKRSEECLIDADSKINTFGVKCNFIGSCRNA